MPFSCDLCCAVDIDPTWRWCPECGAMPARDDLADLWFDDGRGEWRLGASNLF
ncbi:MAG TPA: hypothetical protein VLX59_12010 [Acidimicrobiales bacterium]|nr:hypothetical protein [Acidimicrobiales bacterium]